MPCDVRDVRGELATELRRERGCSLRHINRLQSGAGSSSTETASYVRPVTSGAEGERQVEMTPGDDPGRSPPRSRLRAPLHFQEPVDAIDLNRLLDGTAKPARLSPTIRLGIAFTAYVPVRTASLVLAHWNEFDLDTARWVIPVDHIKMTAEARATARRNATIDAIVPMAAIAVLLTGIGAPLALAVLLIWVVALLAGWLVAAAFLADVAARRLLRREPGLGARAGFTALAAVVLALFGAIPFVGWLASLGALLFGTGALLLAAVRALRSGPPQPVPSGQPAAR